MTAPAIVLRARARVGLFVSALRRGVDGVDVLVGFGAAALTAGAWLTFSGGVALIALGAMTYPLGVYILIRPSRWR